MPDKRKYYLGARFTEKERDYIKDCAKKTNITVTNLLRDAIFSHIAFLEVEEGKPERFELILLNAPKQSTD